MIFAYKVTLFCRVLGIRARKNYKVSHLTAHILWLKGWEGGVGIWRRQGRLDSGRAGAVSRPPPYFTLLLAVLSILWSRISFPSCPVFHRVVLGKRRWLSWVSHAGCRRQGQVWPGCPGERGGHVRISVWRPCPSLLFCVNGAGISYFLCKFASITENNLWTKTRIKTIFNSK